MIQNTEAGGRSNTSLWLHVKPERHQMVDISRRGPHLARPPPSPVVMWFIKAAWEGPPASSHALTHAPQPPAKTFSCNNITSHITCRIFADKIRIFYPARRHRLLVDVFCNVTAAKFSLSLHSHTLHLSVYLFLY